MLKFLEVTALSNFDEAGEQRLINLAHVVEVAATETGGWGGGAVVRLSNGSEFFLQDSEVTRLLSELRGTA